MTYIESTLGDNEKIIDTAHFHWIYKVPGWLCLLAALGVSATVLANSDFVLSTSVLFSIILFCVLGGCLYIYFLLPVWTTEIGVTSHRLIMKKGWLSRQTDELPLKSIEEINLTQSILGRVMNFGTIVIHGTGVDDICIKKISDPLKFRRSIEDASVALLQSAPQ